MGRQGARACRLSLWLCPGALFLSKHAHTLPPPCRPCAPPRPAFWEGPRLLPPLPHTLSPWCKGHQQRLVPSEGDSWGLCLPDPWGHPMRGDLTLSPGTLLLFHFLPAFRSTLGLRSPLVLQHCPPIQGFLDSPSRPDSEPPPPAACLPSRVGKWVQDCPTAQAWGASELPTPHSCLAPPASL